MRFESRRREPDPRSDAVGVSADLARYREHDDSAEQHEPGSWQRGSEEYALDAQPVVQARSPGSLV